MTSKQRAAIYEGIAISIAGFFGAFAIPELFNAHESVAALAGAVLLFGWIGWVAYFIYRMNTAKGL